MPKAGKYLFSNVGFSKTEQPFLSLQQADNFIDLNPLEKTITLRFDTKVRFCVGWRDMSTGEQFACPSSSTVDTKYEQCSACQKRTGFNPAFYNASSVSKQQEARNLQPHKLYLAHFGKGITKVGISYAARGNSRLLEQGARHAVVLETFPTALIARQYEAKIATLPGIVETVPVRRKIATLAEDYDEINALGELTKTRAQIEQTLGAAFTKNDILALDPFYFPGIKPNLSDSVDLSDQDITSGKVTGMLGSLLFCNQQDTPVFLPLKKYIGYPVTLSYDETPLTLPARQISLF
jgi:hypothetical protein